MTFEADGPFAWRWMDVKVKSERSGLCPMFRYQNRKWDLELRQDWDGIIELNLGSYPILSQLSSRFSPFVVSLLVFQGRDARGDYLHHTHRVNGDFLKLLLWQQKTSEVERIFADFSRDRSLSFRIQFTEQNPQRGMISALPAAQPSTLTDRCPQPQLHYRTFADASVQTSLTADSISCLDSLSSDFAKMLVAESDADLEIQCDGHTTRAHKGVLCSRSPVLANMLQSNLLERKNGMVNIQDLDNDTLQKVIDYLYTGRFDDELTNEAVMSLYEAADMYGVQSLRRRCSLFLVQNLTLDNACKLLAVAEAHGDGDLKNRITRYILEEKIPQSGERWESFCKIHPSLAIEVCNQYVNLYIGSEGPSKKRCL